MKGTKPMRSLTFRGTLCVPLSVKVPARLRTQARREAMVEGVTFQEWVTDAVASELARRRRALGV